MKRKISIFAVIVILIAMLLVLTGCGNNTGDTKKEKTKKVTKVGDLTLELDAALNFSDGLAPVCKNEKWGYIDNEGNVVIDFQYDAAAPFSEGMAMVAKYEKTGFIDTTGNLVIDCKYEDAGDEGFQDGVVRVYKDGEWGVIDKEENIIVSFGKYFRIREFKNGIAQVEGEIRRDWSSESGYIDTKGNEIISLSLDNLGLKYFCEDLAVKSTAKYNSSNSIGETKYGYVNSKQNVVIDPKYKVAGDFSEGLAYVSEDGENYGFIDKEGNLVIDYQFKLAQNFSNGYAMVANEDKKCGVIDTKGNLVVDYQYGYISNFSEGFACVINDINDENAKCGFINTKGELVIDMVYDAKGTSLIKYGAFSDGLAAVCKNGKWGYINYDGKVIIGNIE